MDNNFYREALLKLNDIERQILENKCKGLKDRPIWDKLFISEATYYIHKSNIYAKLGLDTVKSYKERAETLKIVVCPIFFTLKPPEIYSEPLPITPPEPPKAELMANPETMAMAIQDGVEEKNEVIFVPPGPIIDYHPRKHFGRLILIGLVILLFLGMAGTIGYLLGRKPAQTIIITATPNQQMTQAALAVPVIPPTYTPTNTLTSTITFTPSPTTIPTDTPIPPTPTNIPTATPFTPFTDNFDTGMNSNWVPVLGTWRTINGQLTADPGGYSEINVGDINWINYAVDVDVFNYDWNYDVSVIVRDSSSGSMILRTNCCDTNWILVNGTENKQIAHLDKGGLTFSGFNGFAKNHIHIEVSGNNYTAYIDGKLFLEVQDSTLTNGRVGLGFGYPFDNTDRFDNFKVSPLP